MERSDNMNIPRRRQSGNQCGTGNDFIAELNEKHAVVMLGGKCVVMNEVTDPEFGRPDVTFSSAADFRLQYANRKMPGEDYKTIADAWLESLHRREYRGIVFSPGSEVPDYYNLWRGFAVDPYPGLDWSVFRNLMRDVICSGNEEHFQYLIHWMADMVQNPGGDRPGVSIVLRGKQGIGKGTFATQFGKLFGGHFLHVARADQFVGRFNQHLKNCLLCFCDEGFLAGDKASVGVLKALITEDTIRIEPKGKDAFAVRNHLRLIIASNHDWIVPAGLEERRFFVLDVGDDHLQDHDYFAAINEQMDNGGREAMMEDLLQVDLTGVNLRKCPQTQALFEQKLHSADPETKWWLHRLQEGTQIEALEEWAEMVPTESLHQDYVEYARNLRLRPVVADALFSRQLRRLCPGIPEQPRKMTMCDIAYGFGRKRMNCLVFPPLEECRSAFEGVIRTTVPWDGDGE